MTQWTDEQIEAGMEAINVLNSEGAYEIRIFPDEMRAVLDAVARVPVAPEPTLDGFARWYEVQAATGKVLPNMGMLFLVDEYRHAIRRATEEPTP